MYELNAETRSLLEAFSGHEVMLVLEMATDLQLEMTSYRGWARLGENGAVELVCALLVWMQDYHEKNGNGCPTKALGHDVKKGKGNCNGQ